ncbi:hypothetical protein Sme01_04940 [Sphaerisporangium melleum]|uniref:non-specific serine/threonine protein kinase n=1 Tax=Sphaerisporangium melleum TaxID=321316 RepID=A0A917QQ77_9ACTN|nr:serine/threonine-protein kinase [Sphaerisporangium melleum]GGK62879.1 hypothetical protein GCM10007964_02510 [Sphaerisporangium melleum]GII68018.1 hypothetical protein Sme01_04940 [Sphaerisporangium melleum]
MLLAARYRLDEPLGRGGMGEVWRATDEVLARRVAVKLLPAETMGRSAAARFRQEAQATARLNHPNVVAIHDFGEADGRLFLVMELIEGGNLADRLAAAGALGIEEVVRIGTQTAAGLAAAHRLGVVHRDVKPANLLLAADGTVKVVDFGIARLADQAGAALTGTGMIVGTGAYLAPERALGREALPASDVYALGCVLYELLAGRPPFRADTPTALLFQHVQVAPAPVRLQRADVPPALDDLLMRLLAKEPEARPPADQVAHHLTAHSAPHPATPHHLPPPPPPAPHHVPAPPAPTSPLPARHPAGHPAAAPHLDPASVHSVPPPVPATAPQAPPGRGGTPATRFLAPLPGDGSDVRPSFAVTAWRSLRRGERRPVLAVAGVAAVALVAVLAVTFQPSGAGGGSGATAAPLSPATAGSASTAEPASPPISAAPTPSVSPPATTAPPSPVPSPSSVVAVGPKRLSDDPRVLLAQLGQGLAWAAEQGRLDPRVAERARHDLAEAQGRFARRGGPREWREAAERVRKVLRDLDEAQRGGRFDPGPALTRLLTHLSGLLDDHHRRRGPR